MKEKIVTVKQMHALDKRAIEKYGIPSFALMENAGCAVAREVKRMCSGKSFKVCIFCGTGNNGGDGFVVARHFVNTSIKVKVFIVGKSTSLKKDALLNYKIAKKLKIPMQEMRSVDKAHVGAIKTSNIVVDAIFGTGLSREVRGLAREVIEAINESDKKVIAVDIPSGLNGTTGKIHGACIKANKTITFACAKKGFFKEQGPKQTGKVIVADIGIPL